MSADPYDWDEEDEGYEDYLDSLAEDDDIYFNPFTGLFPIVERIREYTHDDMGERYTPDVIREVEAVERYIDNGFEALGEYLARHNEFNTYLIERGESVA